MAIIFETKHKRDYSDPLQGAKLVRTHKDEDSGITACNCPMCAKNGTESLIFMRGELSDADIVANDVLRGAGFYWDHYGYNGMLGETRGKKRPTMRYGECPKGCGSAMVEEVSVAKGLPMRGVFAPGAKPAREKTMGDKYWEDLVGKIAKACDKPAGSVGETYSRLIDGVREDVKIVLTAQGHKRFVGEAESEEAKPADKNANKPRFKRRR